MSINVNDKNLGHATAYAYYKAGGGTMTEAEFTEFMADFGTASQTAVKAAQAALASKNAAQTAATTATNKASEATTAATTATNKAAEAQADADAAALDASQAMSAASTATTKATEATTAAATATSAKTDAVAANTAAQSAKTAAQTAQAGAETAAASVSASAAQIQTNADDISELKEDIDVTTPVYTATDGKYITAYGSVSSASGFAYSEPIQVYKGSKVTLKGRGYSNNVAMISLCDSAGSYYSPVVVCPDSTVRTYEYTCIADGYVAISYSTAVTPVLTIGGENSNSVIGAKVRELVSFTGEKDEESNAVPQIYSAGHYITKNGANTTNSDFNIYGPLALNRGDVITVNAKGYLDNVGIIAKVLNGNFTVVVQSTDSTERTYTYTADSSCNVVISSNKSATVTYTVDRKTIPESLEELYDNLPSLQSELCSLSLFEKFGVVGDSFASGELYFNSSYHDKYNISWGQIMARKHGTICTNYSSGGLTTRSWLTATKGLPLLVSSDPDDIYYLALGINDVYSLGINYLGTIADITSHESYADYADTFYGNYGRIIEQIHEHAPRAKIVMFTCASTTGNYPAYNSAIIEIAEHYNIPYIVQADDPFFRSTIYTNMSGSHPTAIGYSGMAVAFERLLNKCIVNNQNYFYDFCMY